LGGKETRRSKNGIPRSQTQGCLQGPKPNETASRSRHYPSRLWTRGLEKPLPQGDSSPWRRGPIRKENGKKWEKEKEHNVKIRDTLLTTRQQRRKESRQRADGGKKAKSSLGVEGRGRRYSPPYEKNVDEAVQDRDTV